MNEHVLSKKQLKKLRKLEEKLSNKIVTDSIKSISEISSASTSEIDYQCRLKLAEDLRQAHATLYRPPIKLTHHTYMHLYNDYFKDMDDTMIGKLVETPVYIMGRVSSSRGAGKLGFLTLYFGPEKIYPESVDVNGWILRPEVQILIRPQTFELASLKQTGLGKFMEPQLEIVNPIFETDSERVKETVKYIRLLSGKKARVFDQYYVIGYPGLSNTGERTIYAKYIFPASINNYMVNAIHGSEEHGTHNFSNQEIGYRNPYIRWLYDINSIHIQILRHQYVKNLKKYIEDKKGLMAVDIPHLVAISSGANAKPFNTYQNDNDMKLQLRIAPELELKMCIIGGLSSYGCYHIGSQFRNESQDKTHNPEFSSCEFYMRNINFTELISISQELISSTIIKTLTGNQIVNHKDYLAKSYNIEKINSSIFNKEDDKFIIQWDKDFININFLSEININLKNGHKLPDANTFETTESYEHIKLIAYDHGVKYNETDSISKILDNIFDELVLPLTCSDKYENSYFKTRDENDNLIITPVTVYGHPKVMSPLAMEVYGADSIPLGIVYRFETFVAGMEICNAYQELSDPIIQKHNFETQRKFQEKGDGEAMTQNDCFIKGLEYGMCPTSGWGMGLDRIYMILSNKYSIRDVLPFPLMKPIPTKL